jgi:preprotein translocase subunit SecG
VLVLLQRGKGADAGAAFGAGASGTVFGARGSGSFFSRATAVCATAFFVTSLTLAYLSSQNTAAPSSVMDTVPEVEEAVEAVESDMPALEATDMPALEEPVLEEDAPDGEQDPQ